MQYADVHVSTQVESFCLNSLTWHLPACTICMSTPLAKAHPTSLRILENNCRRCLYIHDDSYRGPSRGPFRQAWSSWHDMPALVRCCILLQSLLFGRHITPFHPSRWRTPSRSTRRLFSHDSDSVYSANTYIPTLTTLLLPRI